MGVKRKKASAKRPRKARAKSVEEQRLQVLQKVTNEILKHIRDASATINERLAKACDQAADGYYSFTRVAVEKAIDHQVAVLARQKVDMIDFDAKAIGVVESMVSEHIRQHTAELDGFRERLANAVSKALEPK